MVSALTILMKQSLVHTFPTLTITFRASYTISRTNIPIQGLPFVLSLASQAFLRYMQRALLSLKDRCSRYSRTWITGSMCLQLGFRPSICIHYSPWPQTLSKAIVIENASHPVIPTCGRHHTCRMNPVRLLCVVLVEYTRIVAFP